MEFLDCTLRDGANVVGTGFSAELTRVIVEGLIKHNIRTIELGHAHGLGAADKGAAKAPLSDSEYMELVGPYRDQAELGMFLQPKYAMESGIEMAAKKGLRFIRVGANAGEADQAAGAIKIVRAHHLQARYSLMKAYVLSPTDLAAEAAKVESFGAQAITIMDSAGYMLPAQVIEYVRHVTRAVTIPVGFHGHNNMGLSTANAVAAQEAGVASLDCGLLGMARSAGNLATEVAIGVFQRMGKAQDIDYCGLLHFIGHEIVPRMEQYRYHNFIPPVEIILGFSGCHSSFLPLFQEIATAENVDLYRLIVEVSKHDMKAPSRKLIESIAADLVLEKNS